MSSSAVRSVAKFGALRFGARSRVSRRAIANVTQSSWASNVRGRSRTKSGARAMTNDANARFHRINGEMLDTIDEELEMEIDDDRLAKLLTEIAEHPQPATRDRRVYFKELLRLQGELVKLQDWVVQQKLKVVIIFKGRDAAGKGGVIKRITQRLNPRICRVAALPAPSERERTQWYFQRYVAHLPAGGEIVLFDRSWYNRAGVERVMGFCTEEQYQEFFHSAPEFERMLVRSGTHPAEVLVFHQRRGAAISLPHAHPRSAQAMEAQSHGCPVEGALGAIHQSQR